VGRALRCSVFRDAMTQITSADLSRMMAGAAAKIRERHAWLSELDSVAGDGDHGATMLRVVKCLEQAFSAEAVADLKTSFYQAGWSVMGADGGASTSLIGAFFLGMSDSPEPGLSSLDCKGLASAFGAGLSAMQNQTKAQPGDKTMMDALVPAVAALSAAIEAGDSIDRALRQAARSAQRGAKSTSHSIASYGRARLLGEKTRGFQDPGATSIALMFEGFAESFPDEEGEVEHG
jgi:phosphoenolpyruvate---glycerone phosphotransferase subunit DhaL